MKLSHPETGEVVHASRATAERLRDLGYIDIGRSADVSEDDERDAEKLEAEKAAKAARLKAEEQAAKAAAEAQGGAGSVDKPPMVGAGSGRDAWAAYAASVGIEVAAEMGRNEIAAAVKALEANGGE